MNAAFGKASQAAVWGLSIGPSARLWKSVPEKMSGAWVFRNTRLPVAAVFENLEDGVTIYELVELYDGLAREQVKAVLDFAARSLGAPAPAH